MTEREELIKRLRKWECGIKFGDETGIPLDSIALLKLIADCLSALTAQQSQQEPTEPVAWIEHHKAGDNLNWERVDHSYAKATPLYTAPASGVREGMIANLAMMLRRMIWQINKLDGDSSLKVLAGKAEGLISKYGLQGGPLRDDTRATLERIQKAEAGLPVEPETFKFAIDIDTPVAYVVLKDDYDTLRDYAVQMKAENEKWQERVFEFDTCIQEVADELGACCGGVDGDQADPLSTTQVLLKAICHIKQRAEKAEAALKQQNAQIGVLCVTHGLVFKMACSECLKDAEVLAEQNRKDAERYRWLLEDHDDSETRARRASICENMAVKSYSAVSRDIDAAIDSARTE